MDLKHKLFGFSGRMRRLDYWLLWIGSYVVFLIANFVVSLLGDEGLGGLLIILLFVPYLWIKIALMLKRCHDRDKGGGWVAFFLLVPFVGWIWGFIELGFLDGTPGRNRYGPSPKGIGGGEEEDLAKIFA